MWGANSQLGIHFASLILSHLMAIPECDTVQLGFSCFILLSTGHLQACWTSASARSIRKLAVQRRASQLYLPLGFWGQDSNSCLHLHTLLSILDVYRCYISDAISGVLWCCMPSTLFFRNTNRFQKKPGIVIHPNQLAKDRFIQIQIFPNPKVSWVPSGDAKITARGGIFLFS